MMQEQEKRIDFDLQRIKKELQNENIIVSDDTIQISNAYIFKQCLKNSKDKLFLNQYCGIHVELNSVEQLNYNNNKIVGSSKITQELPEIFNEHTLEVKQKWRSTQYSYKKSNTVLFDIYQWKIYIIQQQDGMHHIFRLFSKIFQIINYLWQNHQQYQINLDLNNFALDSDNKIIIFNQSDIQGRMFNSLLYSYFQHSFFLQLNRNIFKKIYHKQIDKKQNIHEKQQNYIYIFGNLMLEILKDVNKFMNEQTSQEKIILNSICELLKLIFQNKISDLNQIRIIFYEIITKIFFSCINQQKYSESFQTYKDQFKIFKNINKKVFLPKYYKNRSLEFDFKQVLRVEIECFLNIGQNKEIQRRYLILSNINILSKRNYQQSVEYLNKSIEQDPYDIDILIGFMMIQVQKQSSKIYSAIRFCLIYLSDLFEDYWQIYYLISWLYDRDSFVKQSQEYMIKTQNLNNTDPQIISLDAIIHLKQKQKKKCEQLIDQAIEMNKMNYPIVYFRKGYILQKQHNYGYCKWYDKSYELDGYQHYLMVENSDYYSKDTKKCIEYYNKRIATNPNNVNDYLYQADNYSVLNNKVVQKYFLDKAIQLFPDNYEGYCKLAIFYRKENNHNEVIKMWNKQIQLYPTDPNYYYFAAKSFRSLSQINSSIQYYKKYLQLNNNMEKKYFSIAHLHQINYDFELSELYALEIIKKSKKNKFNNEVFNELLQYPEEDYESDEYDESDEYYEFDENFDDYRSDQDFEDYISDEDFD